MQTACRPTHKIDLANRIGCGDIVDVTTLRVLNEETDSACNIVDIDPGPPLATTAKRASNTKAQRQHEALPGGSVRAEHEAKAGDDKPNSTIGARFNAPRCAFPGDAHIGEEKARLWGTGLVNFEVTGVTVIADGRGLHPYAWRASAAKARLDQGIRCI